MNEDSIFKRLPLQYIVLCIFTDRPRTPEVVIHAPMEKKGLASSIQTKPPNSAAPPQQKPPSFQPPAQPPTRNPPAPAAPAPQPRAPPSGPPLPSQNNVMQPRSSTMMNPPSRMNQAGPNSAMGGAATSPSITNCDISNTTDNTAMFQMPNHQSRQQPPQQPPSVQPRGRSREPLAPQPPMFQVTSTTSKGQANYSQASRPRGRLGNFLQPWLYICFNDNRSDIPWNLLHSPTPPFQGLSRLAILLFLLIQCQLAELLEIIHSFYKKYCLLYYNVLLNCPAPLSL